MKEEEIDYKGLWRLEKGKNNVLSNKLRLLRKNLETIRAYVNRNISYALEHELADLRTSNPKWRKNK